MHSVYNNNPFDYKGKINRVTYIITYFCVKTLNVLLDFIKYLYDKNHNDFILYAFILGMFVVGILEIFAIIKRLRDIGWTPWLCLIGFIPYVVIVMQLLLIIIKGKENSIQSEDSSDC